MSTDNKNSSISSFRKVNCYPRFCEPFLVHQLTIEQDLKTGEQFFKNCDSLHDAMPSAWKNMSKENQRLSVETIKSLYTNSKEGDGGVWNKTNLHYLVQYNGIDKSPSLLAFFCSNRRSICLYNSSSICCSNIISY